MWETEEYATKRLKSDWKQQIQVETNKKTKKYPIKLNFKKI